MKDFRGKVAVITGGAGGLGRAMAERFAGEGMRIVLGDVDPAALAKAESEMRSAGIEVIGVRVDVSKAADVEALARKTLDTYGAVHLVANNAGVMSVGEVWNHTVADWEWNLGVNLWGVIHGVRVFTPIMLAQGTEGHIVNTASAAGLMSTPGLGAYNVAKHGVVVLTETLHHDLKRSNAKVKCSVLCPAYVPTGIADADRNRPVELRNAAPEKSAMALAIDADMRKAVRSGKLGPADIAEKVYEGVRDERFYIITHPRIKPAIRARMEGILAESEPADPLG